MSFKLPGLGDYSPNYSGSEGMETKSPSYNQFGNQIALEAYPWLQDPVSPPPFHGFATAADMPEQNCLFRYQVLDECYQARFWSRALEFYFLEKTQHSPPYRCLMASCLEQNFQDPGTMLRHLKHCKLFPQGKFWCPTCLRCESFKVVSKERCSWDKINFGRKLLEKYKRALQSFTGNRSRQCPNCSYRIPPENSPVGGQLTPYDVQFNQTDPARSTIQPCELPNNVEVPVPVEMPVQLIYTNNPEPARHFSHNVPPTPQTSNHQLSPSEPSSAFLSRTGNMSDISPASATHTAKSPVVGFYLPESIPMPVPVAPLQATRQTNRRSQVPSLTLDTRQSVVDMIVPEWGFMLDEGQTLDTSEAIGSLAMMDMGPTRIITSQPNEILPLDAHYHHENSLVTPDNTYLHSSPSKSTHSFSNYELSPSSMSSGQGQELHCHHSNCDFKPHGKTQNLRAYLRKHLKKHKNIELPCDQCYKTFTRRDNLTGHIRRVHSTANDSVFKRRRGSSESIQSSDEPKAKRVPQRPDAMFE